MKRLGQSIDKMPHAFDNFQPIQDDQSCRRPDFLLCAMICLRASFSVKHAMRISKTETAQLSNQRRKCIAPPDV
jgi:hypothetical protein